MYGAHSLDLRVSQAAVRNADRFNVVFLVPTGINATIGGHAGDAGPVARLLSTVCDTLIVHPNVVNASDINEMPENALYVEGSVICRLLMGTAGLHRVRNNRVLVVIDRHEEIAYSNAAINAVNAARACYGFDCPRIVMLDPPVKLVSEYTSTGRAAGRVDNLLAIPRRDLARFLAGRRRHGGLVGHRGSAGISPGLLRQ